MTLSCSDQKEHSVPKAVPTLAAAPSTPPASSSKAPLAVSNPSIPATSLPTEIVAFTVAVPLCGGHKKRSRGNFRRQTAATDRNQKLENQLQKAKSLTLRNIPEPLCHGFVKLMMSEVLTIPLFQRLELETQFWTSRILISNCKRTQEIPNRELPETCGNNSGRTSSIWEAIAYWQTDGLNDLRLL